MKKLIHLKNNLHLDLLHLNFLGTKPCKPDPSISSLKCTQSYKTQKLKAPINWWMKVTLNPSMLPTLID